MWELDGQAYNQSDIQSVADRLGISFDEYVKKFNLKKLDDSIDIMEEIEPTTFTLSDTFNQLSTQSVDDSIYNMDASESSENIKTLLDGSNVIFNRETRKLQTFGYGAGGPAGFTNKGKLSYTGLDGNLIESDYLILDTDDEEVIKRNNEILKDFVLEKRKLSAEEEKEYKTKQEGKLTIFENTVLKNPEVIEEINKKEEEYNNPDLFTPYQVTKEVYGRATTGYTFEETVKPYEAELIEARRNLLKSENTKGWSEEKLNDQVKKTVRDQLKYQSRLDINYKATQKAIEQNPSLQDELYVGSLLSEQKELKKLKKVQELIEVNAPIFENVYNAYSKFLVLLNDVQPSDIRSTRPSLTPTQLKELQDELDLLNINVDPNDTNTITLNNGKVISQSLFDAWNIVNSNLIGGVATYSHLMEKMNEASEDAGSSKMALMAAKKNYSLVEKNINKTGLGFLDMFVSMATIAEKARLQFTPIGMLQSYVVEPKLKEKGIIESTSLDKLKKAQVDYTMWSNKYREEFVDDVPFEEAFDSPGNFGKFAAQEIAQQIPIITAIMLSGGSATAAATIGVSTAGQKMMDMQTEIATGRKEYTETEMWLKSLGYGAAEAGFASLTTIPILRQAKQSLLTSTTKSVVDNTLKGMGNWWKDKSYLMYAPFLESLGEGGTQITQNLIDGTDPLLGVDHAGFSGFSFGLLFSAVPFAQSVYTSAFTDYNTHEGLRKLQKQRAELLSKYNRASINKPLWAERIVDIDKKIEVEETNIKNSLNNTISSKGAQSYINLIRYKENLRIEAEQIRNDNSLTIEEKKNEIQNLQLELDAVENIMQKYLNPDNQSLVKNEFVLLKKAVNKDGTIDNEARERYNDLMRKGRNKAMEDKGPNYRPEEKEIERFAYDTYLEEEIRAEYDRAKNNQGVKFTVFETKKEALNFIKGKESWWENNPKKTQEAYDGIEGGADGFNLEGEKIIVFENQFENERKGIVFHEIGHDVFWDIFGKNSKAFDEIAEQLLKTVQNSDSKLYKQWIANFPEINPDNKDTYNSQEVIMRFIELAGRDNFVLNEKRKGLAGFFGAMVQRQFPESFDFKGENDIVNFVVGLAKKISAGTLKKSDIVAARKSKIIPKESKVDMEKQYDLAFSVSPNTLNKLAKEYKENVDTMSTENLTSFVNQYRNVALKALGFDPAKGTITKDEAVSFVDKYFPNITRGFKPTESQFSTYLTNTILKKRQEFYEKEIGDKSKTTSVDDPRAKQVIADTETVPLQKDIAPTIDPLRLFTDTALKDKFIKTTEKALKDQDINALNYKTLKTLDEDAIADIIGIPAKKIFDPTANLSKEELTKALMFINKNASTLFNLLPKANTDLARVPYLNDPSKTTLVGGDPTGIPRSVLNLFYDKGKRIGNNYQWTKKPGLTVDKFKKALGIEGNVKSPDVKVRTNTSQAVKGILELTGRALTNKAVRDILTKQGFTPSQVLPIGEGKSDLMFSQANTGKQKLTSKQLALVIDKSANIITGIANGMQTLKLSPLQATLLSLTSSLNIQDIGISNEVLESYSKNLSKIAPRFIKNLKKNLVQEGEFITVADEALKLQVADVAIAKALGLKINPGLGFDNIDQLKTFRKIQSNYQLKLIKELGDLNGTVYVLKFLKEFNTTSGRIGGGRYQGYAGSKDWFDSFNENLKEKGIEIVYKKTGKGLVPVNVKIKGVKQFKDEKALKVKINNFPQSNNLKREKLIKEYNPRKKEAGEAFDAMVDYLDYVKKNGDKYQFGMSLMALKSNMSALGKRVAYPKYFYKGKTKGKMRFEHMYPSLVLSKDIIKHFYGDGVDLKVLKRNQVVAMIPVEMDARINVLHQESMPSWWKLEMGVLPRYYNALNKGFKDMYALESIGGRDKGKIYGTEFLALNNSILKAAPINNKILPKKDQVKGELINDVVLDKMAEVDNIDNEKRLAFSKSQNLSNDFNKIIENKTGIGADKVYSDVKAQVVGANKGKFNFFVPPSAEDFVGLLYKTLGKGKLGDAQMAWYKKNLLDPFATAMDNISRDRIALMNDFKALKKELKIVPKNLKKKLPGEPFTQEQAVRTYIWNRQGMSPEGMSKKDLKDLTDFVESKPELVAFANQLIAMQKGDQYPAPKFGWLAGNITTDLIDGINTIKRAKYLEQWQYNVDEIFTKANLNKLEAAYGKGYRDALENILKRMRTGRNREFTSDSLTGRVTDWLTNSIGAIMFFNTRSAVLQTISAVNFINFKDNNLFAAGKAFANQPQFWKDFLTLFNSDFLVDRRNGLRLNVNETDIADMAKKGGVRGVISEILRIGFLPTQLADSFAIASGGSTFYRNRVKKYIKEGMSKAEAENQAFIDFREIAEEAQQSSRPDRISQQQAGPLGRIILAFANTPMQYTRLIKKAASDLRNGRGDRATNMSKILYYGFIQNLIFNAMQQALFAMGFGDEEEETEKRQEKYYNIVNSMADSILRGAGVGGAIFSVLKNTAIKLTKESQKKSPKFQDVLVKEIAQLSPPISSKLSKLKAAGRTYDWNKKEIREKGFSLDNPAYLAAGQVIAATTNIPLDRAFKKIDNIRKASSSDYEAWQRIAMLAGWSDWELGIKKSKSKQKPKKKKATTTWKR